MRLDLFLKTSRLVTRRSLAQQFCDEGLIEVNGFTAKSSKDIKAGDRISIKRRDRVTVVAVTTIPEKKQIPKTEAERLFRIESDLGLPGDTLA
ncbi:MAG: S4 domain-containing protein [Acidobacteriota bacterium]